MKFYEFREGENRLDIFNERWYRHPETKKFYRNVTTILGIIDKGYNYDEWLKNVGHNAEIIVDRAGIFGTEFHRLVNRFLLDEKVGYYDNQQMGDRVATALWERFNIWLEFWKELNENHTVEYTAEDIERIVFSEPHEYAGTADFTPKIDGSIELFDWKTGNQIGNKEELQMTFYMQPLGIKKANLVHVPAIKPNKKGYRVKEVEYIPERFELCLATKKIFDMENTDQPKILTLPLEIKLTNLKKEK